MISSEILRKLEIPDGLAITELNKEGFITNVNNKFVTIYGLEPHEALNKHHSEFCDEKYIKTSSYIEFWNQILSKDIVSGQYKRFVNTKAIWVQSTYYTLRDNNNEVISVIIASEDITSQKNHEFELTPLINALNESHCIAKFDLEGKILSINDNFSKLFGYTKAEAVGRHHKIFCDPEYAAGADYDEFWHSLRNGSINTNQFSRLDKNGSKIWIQSSYCPLINEQSKTIGIIKIASDISLQKKLEVELVNSKAEAVNANKSKDNFLSTMSHELRTPLNVIIGLGNILIDEKNLDSQQKEYLTDIVDSGSHLLNLINDVLDLTQITSGNYKYNIQPQPIDHPIRKATRILSVLAANKEISLHFDELSLSSYLVYADKFRLYQILINIITNAIKYNKTGGQVLTSASRVGNQIRISISDTGIGIAPEKLSQLFQPFNRLGAEKTNIEGTGIGLSICKNIIEGMNGSIEVESMQGQGSTFNIFLPEAFDSIEQKISSPQNIDKNELAKFKGNQFNILVVEDHAVNQKLIKKQLDILNYNYELQENGQMALNRITAGEKFDLILSDINMPVMDGFELAKNIRSLGFDGAQLPIVFLTADVFNESFTQWKEVGANAYLTKPTQLDLLEQTLFSMLKDKPAKDRSAPSSSQVLNPSPIDINVLIKLVGDDPEVLNEFLTEFLNSTPHFKQEITSSLREKNWDKLGQSAHRLKSSASLVGATRLSEIATKLQFNCSELNTIQINSLAKDLLPELEIVCKYIKLRVM